jgi:hypothetical protein
MQVKEKSMNVNRIIVERVNPPIPVRDFDWCATFAGYEPGEPQGYGATRQAAIDDLMNKAEEQE